MSKQIGIVGSINIDFITTTESMPRVGETVVGRSFHWFFGGKGANVAVAASRLGGDCVMFGAVGSDEWGVKLKENLKINNVCVNNVVTRECASLIPRQ